MTDLNDMQYFAKVVDCGGFSAAGRALGLPKSRLSRRIANLEARLGVRLLNRTTRRSSLTAAGELYYRHCVAVCDEAQAAAEAIAHVQSEPRGTVRVTCPNTLAQTLVGPLLPGFLEAYPHVQIDMEVSNRVVDLVEEGVDVALRVRTSLSDSGSLIVKQLGRTHSLLVASPALLRTQGAPQAPADLSRIDTIAMSAVDGKAAWRLFASTGRDTQVEHRPRYVADDLLTLKFAALAGTGVCALPDYLCSRELEDGRLEAVLPDWSLEPAYLHAVFPSRRGLMPAVRSFLDYLGEHVAAVSERCAKLAGRLEAG